MITKHSKKKRKGKNDMPTEKKLTGYPSIDKPWLKYYGDKAINAPLPECSAFDMIYSGNKDCLDDIAIEYLGVKFTYGQFFNMVEKCAGSFFSYGIRANDSVIFCAVNMPEIVAAIYAINKLGAVAVLLDPRMNVEQLAEYINECKGKIVVTIDSYYNSVKKAVINSTVQKTIVISPVNSLSVFKRMLYKFKSDKIVLDKKSVWWNSFIKNGCKSKYHKINYQKNHCFLISFTGGTTGVPKGVKLSDDSLNSVAHGYKYVNIPFKRQDKFYNDLPLFIVYGFSLAIHTVLCHGLHLILYPIFDPVGFPKLFLKYKPNHFTAGADHLRYLSNSPLMKNVDLSFLVTAAMGGDTLNEKTEKDVNSFLKKHRCRYNIVKGYGMTELGTTCCTTFTGVNADGSVGIPLVTNTICVKDIENGKELKYGEIGEIWVNSPSLMLGYLNCDEASNSVISIDGKGNRWIKTGDLGYINNSGLLFLKGRIKRIYVTYFEGAPAKIFPIFVEQTLKEMPEIYDCTIVGRLIKGTTYYEPVAYIILNSGAKMSKESIKKYCQHKLPKYMNPVEICFINEFPRTPIGKVDYVKLEKLAKELKEGTDERK